MFRKLHNSFTDVMCNPFHNPGDPIKSRWVFYFFLLILTSLVPKTKKRINPCFLQGLWRDRFCNDGSNWLMSHRPLFQISTVQNSLYSLFVSLHVCLNVNKTQMLKPTNVFVILLQIKYRVNVIFIHLHRKKLKLNKDLNTTSQAATQYIHIDFFCFCFKWAKGCKQHNEDRPMHSQHEPKVKHQSPVFISNPSIWSADEWMQIHFSSHVTLSAKHFFKKISSTRPLLCDCC